MRTRLALFPLAAVPAFAHTGEPLQPHDLWTAWSFEPGIVIPLAIAAFLYHRGAKPGRGMRRWEIACFWLGWAVLALSLASPLHPLGEVLFSAHMTQHELIMTIAAPLLVLGRPLVPFLWGLPFPWRRSIGGAVKANWLQRFWRLITLPATAWMIHLVVLWGWHAPPLFQATLTSDFVHSLQHISFLLAALLFWWSLLPEGHQRRATTGAFLSLFTTAIHTTLLGALLTLSSTIWYPAYAARTQAWGFTPLEDQQLGGLIMWAPAGLVYILGGLALGSTWVREPAIAAAGHQAAQQPR